MSKMLKQIQADPRVSEAFHDSDGYWVYLKAGWSNGNPCEHIIAEDRIADVKSKMRGIVPCGCKECKATPGFLRG
jgi:hypothetical protein